jgi:mono/diheme cytochrome c family protein
MKGVLLLALLAFAGCGSPPDRPVAELYPKFCARCHGADGRGDPRQLPLYPKVDLTQGKWKGPADRMALYRQIADGYGPMPGFQHRMSQQEIERLVEYTLKLSQKP